MANGRTTSGSSPRGGEVPEGEIPADGARQGRLGPRTRWWLGVMAAVAVCGVLAAVVGVTTARATGSLGPHRALYSVTTDRQITVDLGPLGALQIDSPLPWPLGVDVQVQEIPAELTAASAGGTLALADDAAAYLAFFARPEVAIRTSAQAVVTDALGRTVVAWSFLLVVVAAGSIASRGLPRGEIWALFGRRGVRVLVGALAVSAVAVPVFSDSAGGRSAGRTSEVLAGTPLADARIVGRLGDFIDSYGGSALEAVDANTAFYATARTNLVTAYATDPEPLRPAPSDVATEPGDVATEPVAEITPTAASADELVTLLLVADLHCNVGMAPVIGEAVRLAQARVVLNAGDTVIAGTSVESFCVDALAQAIPDGVSVVVADGNHDSLITAKQERDAGFVVLAGDPVVVGGVRIVGDSDPALTTVADPAQFKRDETRVQMAQRLAGAACDAEADGEPIDILLLHNPRAGVVPMTAGCLPVELSGHHHRRIGPVQQGLGVLYVSGSTGGATAGKQSIGPLNSPGVMTVIRFDPVAHRAVDLRVLTVETDASVVVGPWEEVPPRPDEAVEAELGVVAPEN